MIKILFLEGVRKHIIRASNKCLSDSIMIIIFLSNKYNYFNMAKTTCAKALALWEADN